MKTYMANPDKIERKWYVVDASEYTLGRLASEVAKRPNVLPSASTTYHFLSMVAGLAINVFMGFPP